MKSYASKSVLPSPFPHRNKYHFNIESGGSYFSAKLDVKTRDQHRRSEAAQIHDQGQNGQLYGHQSQIRLQIVDKVDLREVHKQSGGHVDTGYGVRIAASEKGQSTRRRRHDQMFLFDRVAAAAILSSLFDPDVEYHRHDRADNDDDECE